MINNIANNYHWPLLWRLCY